MPRKKEPAHLWLRPDTGYWFIKDDGKRIATGCPESDVAGAEAKFHAHIGKRYKPVSGRGAAEIDISEILIVYNNEKADSTSRPKETKAAIDRLNDFWGDLKVNEVRGKTCREFADERGTDSGARRDLEVMRAAINYYHKEYGLDVVPAVTLPLKSEPRQQWLTRSELAKLIRAARKLRNCEHLVRLLLVGVYTGTRLSAILGLQWMPNTTGGYVDLDRGVMYRKAEGERVAHNKRKPPVKIPPRLLRFLRYWKEADTAISQEDGKAITIRHIVHYQGKFYTKPHKAFRAIRAEAGLPDVTPHVLRHTRATWLAQAGVDAGQAAASLGMTEDEYERTYLHVSPDFQADAANAF
jgi:integrase